MHLNLQLERYFGPLVQSYIDNLFEDHYKCHKHVLNGVLSLNHEADYEFLQTRLEFMWRQCDRSFSIRLGQSIDHKHGLDYSFPIAVALNSDEHLAFSLSFRRNLVFFIVFIMNEHLRCHSVRT